MLDQRLPDIDGVDLLGRLRLQGFSGGVVVVTAYGTIRSAVESMRLGATGYVEKPIDAKQLVQLTAQASSVQHARQAHGLQWPPRHRSGSVDATLKLIEEHCTKPTFTLEAATRLVGLSREYLCRLLKRETGQSFLQHLYSVRVSEAERLLATTRLRVKEVAAQTGFQSTAHMDSWFRRLRRRAPNAGRTQRR